MKKARMGISGALAGAVNGLFGGGGGMVLAPLLESWCRVEEKRALANCVATILPCCVLSGGVYLVRTGLDWGQGPAAAHGPLGAGDGRRCLLGGHGPGRDPAAAPLWDFSPDCRRGNTAAQIDPAPFREISRSRPCIMDGGKEAEP